MDAHSRPPKLMDRVKATVRAKRYSPRTEKTVCILDSLLHQLPQRTSPRQHGAQMFRHFWNTLRRSATW